VSAGDPSGPPTIHASAVLVGSAGILIRGEPASGKSALALALIEDPRGDAVLIADDRVAISARADAVIAAPPASLAGLIEVRGIGIVRRPFRTDVPIRLVVDLLPPGACPRIPDERDRVAKLCGRLLPRLTVPIGAADAALRVRVALREWAV
jgi:HPr kinase/phosphorylase